MVSDAHPKPRTPMILTCNYEELQALKHGADLLLQVGFLREAPPADELGPVERMQIEQLRARLGGDLSVQTLGEQVELYSAVSRIVAALREEMDARVLVSHPADEGAVASYFDFAHALSVLGRLDEIGRAMRSMLEIVAVDGDSDDEQLAAELAFPD